MQQINTNPNSLFLRLSALGLCAILAYVSFRWSVDWFVDQGTTEKEKELYYWTGVGIEGAKYILLAAGLNYQAHHNTWWCRGVWAYLTLGTLVIVFSMLASIGFQKMTESKAQAAQVQSSDYYKNLVSQINSKKELIEKYKASADKFDRYDHATKADKIRDKIPGLQEEIVTLSGMLKNAPKTNQDASGGLALVIASITGWKAEKVGSYIKINLSIVLELIAIALLQISGFAKSGNGNFLLFRIMRWKMQQFNQSLEARMKAENDLRDRSRNDPKTALEIAEEAAYGERQKMIPKKEKTDTEQAFTEFANSSQNAPENDPETVYRNDPGTVSDQPQERSQSSSETVKAETYSNHGKGKRKINNKMSAYEIAEIVAEQIDSGQRSKFGVNGLKTKERIGGTKAGDAAKLLEKYSRIKRLKNNRFIVTPNPDIKWGSLEEPQA